jgi:hypothetical protein
MPKDEKQMQRLADLGQKWKFLSTSLKPDRFKSDDATSLQAAIEDLIYDYSGRINLAAAIGIIEVVKLNLHKDNG